jgi:PAS domain S-box-containing protein
MNSTPQPTNPTIRVLHLEDNQRDAELVRAMLEAEGFTLQVTRVDTEGAFTKCLEENQFDLIISDHTLPGYNGLAALQKARALHPEIPYLFVSGTLGEDVAVESLKHGATDYVLKRHLTRLAPAVRRALREAEERAQHRRAEKRIIEQAELLNRAHDAITVQNLEGRVTYWNQGAERLFGWTVAEAVGALAGTLFGAPTAEQHHAAHRAVLDTGRWEGELHVPTKSGGEVVVESRWSLVRDEQGNPKSFLIICTDITEKTKLEAQFLRAQRLENLGALASGIAHDLNNVLAPIMMSVELLRGKMQEPSGLAILDTLAGSVQRGAGMVSQILAFARGVEGKRIELQVQHLMRELVNLVKDTFPKTIQLRVETPKDLWPVLGNPTQLHQVLLNLCVNARDAMPNGGLLKLAARNVLVADAEARGCSNAQPGPYTLIEVSDTGTGIPPEIINRIFDPFFTTKALGQGTGLGLATVRGIVQSHKGFLRVASQPGVGTQFRVYLPAFSTGPSQPPTTRAAHLPAGNGERVLVIDDEPSVRQLLQLVLETFSYRVVAAANGPEGLQLARDQEDPVRVALVDLSMPLMDGTAVIRDLQKLHPGLPIIPITGQADSARSDQLAALGLKFMLSKPFTAEKLLQAVHRALLAKSA